MMIKILEQFEKQKKIYGSREGLISFKPFILLGLITPLIIRPGLSRLLEFDKDIKTDEKNFGCSRQGMKPARTDGFGIPERWEFQIPWLFPARLEISFKAFILLELLL